MSVLLRRLWIQVTADRRRFGLFCALVALGFLLWARIIVISNIPKEAVANPKPSQPKQPNGSTAGTDNTADEPVQVAMARRPLRDPFEINPLYFPNGAVVVQNPQVDPKLPPNGAENPDQAEARLEFQLRALIDRFKLEAVMGGNPMAVISGQRYGLGAEVPAIGNEMIVFRLVDIEHRTVTLDFEGRRFVLKMK